MPERWQPTTKTGLRFRSLESTEVTHKNLNMWDTEQSRASSGDAEYEGHRNQLLDSRDCGFDCVGVRANVLAIGRGAHAGRDLGAL